MYLHRLSGRFFAERAGEMFYRRYKILEILKTLSQAPGDTVQSPEHPGTLFRKTVRELLEFRRSTTREKEEL